MSKDDFLALLKKHQGIIYKLVSLYANDGEEKKDLYQEILLQAWKSFRHFRGESQFSTWLYKVALYTILTQKRKVSVIDYKGTMEEYVDQFSAEAAEPVRTGSLRTAIRRLPETDRAIVSLHLDGYENREIAALIGISANHVAVKLHRIKQYLSTKIKQIE